MAQHTRPTRRAGFSLAELMIAIVILGLGLLFIAAALPVGIDYSRRNVERAEGEAAAVQALDTLELALRTATAFDPTAVRLGFGSGSYGPASAVFRPRPDANGDGVPEDALNNYEPIIKVRPLVMRNVQGRNAAAASTSRIGHHVVDRTEDVIRTYLEYLETQIPFPFSLSVGPARFLEADIAAPSPIALSANPVLPATARFFPPPTSVNRIYPEDFEPLGLSGGRTGIYPDNREADNAAPGLTNPLGAAGVAPEDIEKLFDRRISWTAFYRRVEYNKYQHTPGVGVANAFGSVASDGADPAILYPPPPPAVGDTFERAADPLLYELIVVVTRRPSENHFFAHQDLTIGPANRFANPRAAEPGDTGLGGGSPLLQIGEDRLAPMPWLVTFDGLPNIPASSGGAPPVLYTNGGEDRSLSSDVSDRPTLEFRCSPRLGDILPVGSILIPARNDYRPTALLGGAPDPLPGSQANWAGFIPSAPDETPIYRVVDRPNASTVIVENNGFYPWLSGPTGISVGGVTPKVILDTLGEFPFWVIPPAFEGRLQDGTPLFERRSPILKVSRRLIRLPEVR